MPSFALLGVKHSTRRKITDASHLPGLKALQRGKTFRNDRQRVLDPVRSGTNDQHGDSHRHQVLLVGDLLVEGQQDIEKRVGECQQRTVLRPRPSAPGNGAAGVTLQMPRKLTRQILVDLSSMRIFIADWSEGLSPPPARQWQPRG